MRIYQQGFRPFRFDLGETLNQVARIASENLVDDNLDADLAGAIAQRRPGPLVHAGRIEEQCETNVAG